MPIPWKHGNPSFPDNKFLAMERLDSLDRRPNKLGLSKIYDMNIQNMIDKGYAERVPIEELI